MTAFKPNRRIMMDIQNIQSDEVKSLRIYYNASDTNIYKGIALIFGPAGSIYEDLPVLLEIEFPNDYPFTNPKVKFVTSDGRTRFHPNLYVEGKVCLSILGTWSGPSWTSVMTLKTVLLSIMGILDEEPLLHEPGYSTLKGSQKSKDYSNYVEHSCLRYIVTTLERFKNNHLDSPLNTFEEELQVQLPNIYKRTMERLTKLAAEPKKTWSAIPYNMSGVSIYEELLKRLQAISL
jgi:ubiquitin-protein ligase